MATYLYKVCPPALGEMQEKMEHFLHCLPDWYWLQHVTMFVQLIQIHILLLKSKVNSNI